MTTTPDPIKPDLAGTASPHVQVVEPEVAMERQSLFAGPSLHYGGADYWFTLT